MIDVVVLTLQEVWYIPKEASIFLLLGVAFAGVLAALVRERTLPRSFGASGSKSAFCGSAIGAPLPPCSCGVLPAALGLRRGGTGIGRPLAVR
jgi:uncharacterized membrane protein YraQ (UPF0718 family)